MANNRVNWTDGLFLKPQMFQQEMRYVEGLVESRSVAMGAHTWGFQTLEIDTTQQGRLAIIKGRGVFPDGTPFSIPDEVDPPIPLDLPERDHTYLVRLCLPSRGLGELDIEERTAANSLARYYPQELTIRNASETDRRTTTVPVARLRAKLFAEDAPGHEALGVARVVEISESSVKLDEDYIPPWVDCSTSQPMKRYLSDLRNRLGKRGEDLAGRLGSVDRLPQAQVQNAMMLAMVNRYEALVHHFDSLAGLHPERFYELAVALAGEVSTYVKSRRRAPQFSGYRHESLRESFEEVFAAIRAGLTDMPAPAAKELPLKPDKANIWIATVPSAGMLQSCEFVLAVEAEIPTKDLVAIFDNLVTVAAQEHLWQLVVNKLPGTALVRLGREPDGVPGHGSALYYRLERKDEHFRAIANAIGLHVNYDLRKLPDLRMTLWAVPEHA